MTLTAALDPFGFWQAPPPARPLAFSAEATADAPAQTAAAVWTLDLSPADGGAAALAARAGQVAAVEQGLGLAEERLDTFLARRSAARRAGALAFSAAGEAEPERFLADVLDSLDPPGGPLSYGLREDLAALAARARGLNPAQWGELRARLEELFESVNRQIAHFVWVDTTLAGRLAARTTIRWSGDLTTCCWSGLNPAQVEAHRRSLALACAARAAQMQTLLTVAQMAGKIALAVATPLGPLQALALAWQFLHGVVLPLLEKPAPPAAV